MISDLPGCHVCGEPPVHQWTRLATEQEAAAQREEIATLQGRTLTDDEIAAKYGPLRTAVTGCAEHGLDEDGTLRTLLHDADCAGHGACACQGVAS